jgi:hypothetical protein
MNKIDDAWAALKKLSPDEQDLAAEAILDYADRTQDFGLSDEQVAEVKSRMQEADPKTITVGELRSRILGS